MTRGIIFLVVGPSGVGKDSLLDGARDALGGDQAFVFPARVITRPAAAGGECHIESDEHEFHELVRDGAFALHWNAHGLRYGIPKAIEDDLARGRHVVVNVSRGVIDVARKRLAPAVVVHVTVPADVLERRLTARGRESADEIASRLARASAYDMTAGAGDIVLVNDRALDESVAEFIAALRGAVGGVLTAHGPARAAKAS